MSDLRSAVRALIATPIVSLVAIVSLALGIGATTALFSVYDSLLLRELPVREPDRLVLLSDGSAHPGWSNVLWEEIRRRPNLFDGAFAYNQNPVLPFKVTHQGKTDVVDGLWASGRFFDVLGVKAVLGRMFRDADDRRGGGPDGPVAVISHAFWQRRFGGATDVIGRSLAIERVPFTIVGVAPPEFFGLLVGRAFDVAVPIGTSTLVQGFSGMLDAPDANWLTIGARLKRGQTPQIAAAALGAMEAQIPDAAQLLRSSHGASRRHLELRSMTTGDSRERAPYQKPIALILAVAGFVLLIACANIANLLLARAAARRHEIGVRRALGASSLRLARQCLVESLLLSGIGAVLGLALARVSAGVLVTQLSSATSTFVLPLPLDWRVLGFTAIVAVVTSVLFGMAPAWQASRVQPNEVLGASGRTLAGEGRQHLDHTLVVAQVALSLVLVVGAVLFVRTFAALATRDIGFDRDRILIATADAPRSGATRLERLATVDRIREAVAAVPGVAAVTASWTTPASGATFNVRLAASDYLWLTERDRLVAAAYVSPGWFATYGTRLLSGRDFTDADLAKGARPVAIVNEAFVRRYLGGRSAIGATVRSAAYGKDITPLSIVGLARDSSVHGLLRVSIPPAIYLPMPSVHSFGTAISVRVAHGSPARLARDVETAMKRVDPNLTVTFRSLSAQLNATIAIERVVAILSAFFGALALLLAGLGLYGVTAYAVGRRRAEIGVRMALGAAPGSVVRLMLRRVTILVGLGVVIGGLVSYWAARLTETLLFGVTPRDPLSFAGAALVLAATGLLAAWLPARRASRVDPTTALRSL